MPKPILKRYKHILFDNSILTIALVAFFLIYSEGSYSQTGSKNTKTTTAAKTNTVAPKGTTPTKTTTTQATSTKQTTTNVTSSTVTPSGIKTSTTTTTSTSSTVAPKPKMPVFNGMEDEEEEEQEEVVKERSRTSSYDNPEHTSENLMSIKSGWFVGADIGTSIYYGDVALYDRFPKPKDFDKSLGYGYSLFGGKKFKFGLSAELQLFKGTLTGEKRADKLYPRYFKADVMSYAINAKYNLSQRLFRSRNDRSFFNRLALYATVGGGQAFFSSRLYKYANNDQWYLERANGFSVSGIDSAGISSAGGLVQDKSTSVKAFILPIGGKINFKLNQRSDLVLDINYVTVFSDKVDSWERNWSHKDRYLYLGLGVIYNFGFDYADDIPSKDRFIRPKDKSYKTTTTKSKKSSYKDAYSPSSRKAQRRSTGNAKDDKDLEIKLKMYELQLKLFEMQYLVD